MEDRTVHGNEVPCAHLDIRQCNEPVSISSYLPHRICAQCGIKGTTLLSAPPSSPTLFRRSDEFVTAISPREYRSIEKSFDVKRQEYRDRVFLLLEEAIKSKAISLGELGQVIKNHTPVR